MILSSFSNRISPFQMAKQAGDLLNNEESLVFTYPFVIDSSLQKEWSSILRDFFIIQLQSQIKSSNILNITSSMSNQFKQTDLNYKNPAQDLFLTLQGGGANAPSINAGNVPNYLNLLTQQQSRQDTQSQIDSFRDFISNQIKNDPIYENLRPIASLITIEDNINIPLVLASKELKFDSKAMFWTLFLSLADNRSLTSSRNSDIIVDYIKRIPKEKYLEILSSNTEIDANKVLSKEFSLGNNEYKRINQLIDNSVTVNFRRLSNIFNEERWLHEVGIGRPTNSKLSFSSSQIDLKSFENDTIIRFSNMFIGFINHDLVRILQSLSYVLVSTTSDNIDFTLKYQTLINEMIDISKSEKTLNIIREIINSFYASGNTNEDDIMMKVESFCKNINTISVKDNLDTIHKSRIKLVDISYKRLLSFMDDFTTNSNNLIAATSTIKKFISSISNANESDFVVVERSIYKSIKDFFESNRFGDSQVIFDNVTVPPIFRTLTGINDINRTKAFFNTCYLTLTEFVKFCYYYSLIGHICEYFKELKVHVDIKRKNALSFPNYVMVVPKEYIAYLYNAMSYKRVSDIFKTRTDPSLSVSSKFEQFRLNEQDISMMILRLNDIIKIPNIIVVDSKTRTIYYKWNYLNRVLKLNENSVKTYIKNQRSLIQIF